MKTIIIILTLSLCQKGFGSTLNCVTKDLATSDILSEKDVGGIDPATMNDLVEFDLENDFVSTHVIFSKISDSDFVLTMRSLSDTEVDEKIFAYKIDKLKENTRLGSVAVMSASANLDTIFTYCDWK